MALLVVIGYAGVALILYSKHVQSSALEIPLWIPYLVIPLSSVLIFLVTLRQLLQPVREGLPGGEDYA